MTLAWQIGEVRVTRVVESVAPIPPEGLFPGRTEASLTPHLGWLRPWFVDDDGNLVLSIHGFVVETPSVRILVDTCIGDRALPDFPDLSPGSVFLDNLVEAGFDRNDIDVVCCTHLHFDHVGTNTMLDPDAPEGPGVAEGEVRWIPTFPRARYLFGRVEYEHWSRAPDDPYVTGFHDAVVPVFEAGQADLVETDHRITDEVWLEATPGHTPGHVAVRIESGGQRALITGDLTHHPVQWAEVDWEMSADSDSAAAAVTRRRLLAEHADTDLLVLGTHYAEPCAGRLVRDENGGHRFEASTGPSL